MTLYFTNDEVAHLTNSAEICLFHQTSKYVIDKRSEKLLHKPGKGTFYATDSGDPAKAKSIIIIMKTLW
jgi:hypothetical protein